MTSASGNEEFQILLTHLLDRTIEPEQLEILQKRLAEDPQSRKLYIEFMVLSANLHRYAGSKDLVQPYVDDVAPPVRAGRIKSRESLSPEEQLRVEAIQRKAQKQLEAFLAKQERVRPSQTQTQDKSEPFLSLLSDMAHQTQIVLRFSWTMTKRMGIAAVIVLVCLLSIQAYRMNRVVAVLGEQVHASWMGLPDTNELRPGLQILEEGYARIHFKQGASVLVQAPCEFELLTPNRMYLSSGRVCVKIPTEASGFRIDTDEGTVVDYGTEFGVGIGNQLDIHVFKGKVLLNTDARKMRPASRHSLEAGQAATLIPGKAPSINSVINQPSLFTRDMPDPNHLIGIPGVTINLADLVGGGNGYGTGRLDWGIDMNTGRMTSELDYEYERTGPTHFVEVSELMAVDGVFVPDGDRGSVQINSAGQTIEDCSDTSGFYWTQIANGARMGNTEGNHLCKLQGITYGRRGHSSLLVHPNVGITFDLQAIRQYLSDRIRIVAFQSLCGVSETVADFDPNPDRLKSDFYVYMGDEKRFEAQGRSSVSEPLQIDIVIHPNDRFLTLMATDSDGLIDSDWVLFANPVLVLDQVIE